MTFSGIKSKVAGLESAGIHQSLHQNWNLTAAELVEETIKRNQGVLADSGALCVNTGKFTGRSPKDKFAVMDDYTRDTVWWSKNGGTFNHAISSEAFEKLLARVINFIQDKELFVRDMYAGADETYRIKVRVVNLMPWQNLFADNMFINPATTEELENFSPDWHVIAISDYEASGDDLTTMDAASKEVFDGVKSKNFSIIDFTRKIVLVGGSAYTGEMKKGIFTVLNCTLPVDHQVLPMHCSANEGKDGDVAVFFGLSGTGKTTLSADPERYLIGDDEHGWSDNGVFNFEGGCYAKCIDLTEDKEPQIWAAVKPGALLENIVFNEGTNTVNFENGKGVDITGKVYENGITENTRVSYPISFIPGAKIPSKGGLPKNIFFLTCDAFGVLPPISKLTAGQAMYQFVSGYTAKVAGTEVGVTEPTLTFSTCFGAPFLPLHPAQYADLLGKKIGQHNTNVWLINTGWTGGKYGVGSRMKLKYTRAMITAVLNGDLDNVSFETITNFELAVPTAVPNVPAEVLVPRNTWADKAAYDAQIEQLAEKFVENFKKFEAMATEEMKAAAPKVAV
ncbi:MAG: phosphoenolpyruvate carboxykinase (ATP) [Bacteroidia bacterium]